MNIEKRYEKQSTYEIFFVTVSRQSLFIGAYVDRLNKRYLIIGSQLILAVLAVFYSVLVFSGHIQFWHILILASLQGIVSAVEMPARQSFIVELVGKEDLMNAIALNSTIFNAARIVGPPSQV